MTLPCLQTPPTCQKFLTTGKRCRWGGHVVAGIREAEWVGENKCVELQVRGEG